MRIRPTAHRSGKDPDPEDTYGDDATGLEGRVARRLLAAPSGARQSFNT
jgi:hypothetical protein